MNNINPFHLAIPVTDLDLCRKFYGEVGEQATMFFLDQEGNALEFKAFKNINTLFAK